MMVLFASLLLKQRRQLRLEVQRCTPSIQKLAAFQLIQKNGTGSGMVCLSLRQITVALILPTAKLYISQYSPTVHIHRVI